MKKSVVAVVAFLSLFAACSPTPTPQSSDVASSSSSATSVPEFDFRSPDSVVKSYWAGLEWMRENETFIWDKDAIKSSLGDYLVKMDSLGTGDFKAYTQKMIRDIDALGVRTGTKRIYKFDIIEVRNESETRAVVIAKVKNVTPIPAVIKLTEDQQEDRDYGSDLKFVVEKTNDGWRLSQGWERSQAWINLAKIDDSKSAKEIEEDSWHKVWEVKPESNEPSVYDFTGTPSM